MKEIDYYGVLNVRRDATTEEIALAYRKLAVQHHPNRDRNQRTPLNPPEGIDEVSHLPALSSVALWGYVNKAYDILSNPLRRQVYDVYGETGLRNGVPLPDGHFFQSYVYHEDYFRTYNEVFGSYSPYADAIDAILKPLENYSKEKNCIEVQDKPIEKLLYLDLKEIYEGVAKRMKILRHEFVDNDETRTEIKEKTLIVPVASGTLPGTRITFKRQGDRGISRIPADIIFITADKPHETFTRKLSDLYMTYEINLKQALCGFRFKINTIDDRKLLVTINDVVHPNYIKEIRDEGLPKPHEINKKGNLYVNFAIKFPEVVSRDWRSKFIQLFNELEDVGQKK